MLAPPPLSPLWSCHVLIESIRVCAHAMCRIRIKTTRNLWRSESVLKLNSQLAGNQHLCYINVQCFLDEMMTSLDIISAGCCCGVMLCFSYALHIATNANKQQMHAFDLIVRVVQCARFAYDAICVCLCEHN